MCFLDRSYYLPSINLVWSNCDSDDALNIEAAESSSNTSKPMNKGDKVFKRLHEGRILELWKIVKDDVAHPLLMDLCEKTGLSSPPCFASLPRELKLK
ncbi:hypothetical protein MKW94_012165, partial [Papaver nudicaule]|nr:hypothetical protein [Papaver nudicaule]